MPDGSMPKQMPKPSRIFVSMSKVHDGPPKPHEKWNFISIRDLLRSAKVEVEEVINWTKAPDGLGYYIYYYGALPSEQAQRMLH